MCWKRTSESPEYCIDGCPKAEKCPYNAVKIYLDNKENDWFRTTCTREAYPTYDIVEKALRTTQYGKCVFKCDNDVVDHQTVNLLYEDGATVNFNMNAFNKGGRFIHIIDTRGYSMDTFASCWSDGGIDCNDGYIRYSNRKEIEKTKVLIYIT